MTHIGQPTSNIEAAAEVRRATFRLARRLRAERPAGGLSPNKLSVLSHLYRHGPATPGAVATAEHQQPQSLTRVYADLEHDGLIRRSPGRKDRRQTFLELTSAGRNALIEDMTARDTWLASAMQILSTTEQQILQLAAPLMDRMAEAMPLPCDKMHAND